MTTTYQCSVILAAHGSEAHADSNNPLFELADQIAASEIFSVVTPAFFHGEPNATTVMSLLPPGDVVVVPVMTSDGYYLQNVLPGKLAANPSYARFRVLVTAPLGLHPEIPSLVADRVSTLMMLLKLESADTTIVIVGHGTRRHPDSGKSTEQLAARLAELLPEDHVTVAFIDQNPTMAEIIAGIETLHTIVVPFLISRGPHATVDVPAAFGLPTGPDVEFPLADSTAGRITICDLPIGMYPEMSDLCIELVADQLMQTKPTTS